MIAEENKWTYKFACLADKKKRGVGEGEKESTGQITNENNNSWLI